MAWEFDPKKYEEILERQQKKVEEQQHKQAMEDAGVICDGKLTMECTDNTKYNLVKTDEVFGVPLDVYQRDSEYFMTREQIGTALGYDNPKDAIAKIHRRHADRLDKWSAMDKLSTPAGTQESVVYSARGVYEICRWSRSERADEFQDRVYDILEEIRTKGFYSRISDVELLNTLYDRMLNNPEEFAAGLENSNIRGFAISHKKKSLCCDVGRPVMEL